MLVKTYAAIESITFERRLLEEEVRELSKLGYHIPMLAKYRHELQSKAFALL